MRAFFKNVLYLPQNNFHPSLYRCVVLSDPLKDSSRSQESWNAFLTKLRTLLLMSFTKNLGKFEDDMRTLREKRTEPGWSFCEYFMVQVRVPLYGKKSAWVLVLIKACCCPSGIFNVLLILWVRRAGKMKTGNKARFYILTCLKRLCAVL